MALALGALLSGFPTPAPAQPPPFALEDPSELLVLLADGPEAPSPAQVVQNAESALALPEPLDLGAPTGARFLISERPAVTEAIDPASPRGLLLRYLVVSYPPAADLAAIEQGLASDGRVLHAGRNRAVPQSPVIPSDPIFPQQWGIPALDLPDAWDRSFGHAYVALVDNGIDATHPDFRPFDDNGLYLGGNFSVRLSHDFGYDDDDVDEGQPQLAGGQLRVPDIAGHGTHVAGIAGATTDNAEGVAGACPHCALIVAKGSRLVQLSTGQWANLFANEANVIDAFYGAVDRGTQLLSMSFGYRAGTCSPDCAEEPMVPFCLALAYGAERDVVMTASSGNDGDDAIDFPASDARVLAAGGLESSGGIWDDCTVMPPANCVTHLECGTNYGPDQFLAPAKEVISTFYRGIPYAPSIGCDDSALPGFPGYGPCSGTSMSSPLLAGSIGILRSINPLLLGGDLETVLLASLDNPPGWDPQFGYGKPDFAVAADAVLGVAAGAVLPNRLSPLFTAYSTLAETHFYSTAPQMMTAAFFDSEAPAVPAEGSATPGYGEFPGTECHISPCQNTTPTASVYVFTTPSEPFPGALPLVPLYRMGFDAPKGGNPLNRSFFYTTEALGLELGKSIGYELDGREGYIFQRCTPEPSCIPDGAVRLYRYYHFDRDDYAIFPESELPSFVAQGYGAPPGLNAWIGYVYPNTDTDGDELIDGFETVVGTSPVVSDSDCDGITDGDEVNGFPYSDPVGKVCGSIAASPEVLVLPPGQLGTSDIRWFTSGTKEAQVWVRIDSGQENLFAQATEGQLAAGFIQPNRAYEFLLYRGLQREELLDYVTVFGLVAGGGQVSAQPRPVPVAPGTLGTTVVSWATNGMSAAQVWVSANGAPEVLFAQKKAGSQAATWIQNGSSYVFRLYAGTAHTVLLDQITVVGVNP